MAATEQLAEQYQICMEEQREYEIDDLLRECERHHKEQTLQEFVSESLSAKGVDAASFHQWERQKEELQVLRGLERLRPEWDQVLDGVENGFMGAEKNTTGIVVKNFTKCTEASAATKKNGRTWVNSF